MSKMFKPSMPSNWYEQPFPEELYYWDENGETLKRIRFTKELWEKTKQNLDKDSEPMDIINYLRLSDKTEITEVKPNADL